MPKKYIGIAGNPDGGWPYYMEYNPTVFSPYPTDMYDKKCYGLEGSNALIYTPNKGPIVNMPSDYRGFHLCCF